jgi:hypothetical protein
MVSEKEKLQQFKKDKLQQLCIERIEYQRGKTKRATIAELRKLLKGHGVKFDEFKFMTQWTGVLGEKVEAYPTDIFPDTLLVKHVFLTPEQAIKATVGPETCRIEHYDTDVLLGERYYRCTACHTEIFNNLGYRFCPYCGAKVVD